MLITEVLASLLSDLLSASADRRDCCHVSSLSLWLVDMSIGKGHLTTHFLTLFVSLSTFFSLLIK